MNNERGSLTLELILVMGVLAVILTAGLGSIRWHLERALAQSQEDIAWLELTVLRRSVEDVWDQRCSHILREGPWLEIESIDEGGDNWSLQRLSVLYFNEDGNLYESTWSPRRDGWGQDIRRFRDTEGRSEERLFRYNGRIGINMKNGSFVGGEGPSIIQLTFPDLASRRLRQGFAIRRYW